MNCYGRKWKWKWPSLSYYPRLYVRIKEITKNWVNITGLWPKLLLQNFKNTNKYNGLFASYPVVLLLNKPHLFSLTQYRFYFYSINWINCTYKRATYFDLYFSHSQSCQYKNRTKRDTLNIQGSLLTQQRCLSYKKVWPTSFLWLYCSRTVESLKMVAANCTETSVQYIEFQADVSQRNWILNHSLFFILIKWKVLNTFIIPRSSISQITLHSSSLKTKKPLQLPQLCWFLT